jgi:hypothetical protein
MSTDSPNSPDLPPDVRELLAAHRAPSPPAMLLSRTRAALAEAIEARVRAARAVVWKLAAVGVIGLPVALAIDAALWTVVRAAAEWIVPAPWLTSAWVVFVAWNLLGLCLTYGALPFLGAWAVRGQGVADERV